MDMIGEIDHADIRKDFAVTRKTIYMNNGAIAPTPLSTIKAVTNFLLKVSEAGPDTGDTAGYLASLLSEVRTRVSHLINCDKDEVVLTESTTQGLNIVANGIAWEKGDAIVVRGGKHEHYANYFPWRMTAENYGLSLRQLAVDRNGVFDLHDLENAARGSRLITMSHVLYNTGAIMPVEEVGRIAAEHDVLFCVDAAQSAGALPIDVRKIGCHFMAFPGFKWICGPLGIGVLFCSKKIAEMLKPSTVGGESAILSDTNVLANMEMPARLQSGFRNYPGAAGLEAALRYVLRIGIVNILNRNLKVSRVIREELGRLPGVTLYGPEDDRQRSSIVSFLPPEGMDPETLVKKLEESSVVFAARDAGEGRKVVRASPHFFNDETEAATAISYVKRLMS
jgi:cysteine desulfurase / selenocysteine lyase